MRFLPDLLPGQRCPGRHPMRESFWRDINILIVKCGIANSAWRKVLNDDTYYFTISLKETA